MGVRRRGGVPSRTASLWITCTCFPTARSSQTCPFKMMRGSSEAPKIRSLSPSAETTSVHLSFFARVSGVMSCLLSIWSSFVDWLFTNRDREGLALLHHHPPSVDDLTADDG